MANSHKSPKKCKKQRLAIINLRFHGVLIIIFVLDAEGHRFDAGWNQTVL